MAKVRKSVSREEAALKRWLRSVVETVGTQKDFLEKGGLSTSKSGLSRMLNENDPAEVTAAALLAACRAAGKLPPMLDKIASSIDQQFTRVARYDQGVSAGPGYYADQNAKPVDQLAFRTDWLHTITSSNPRDMFVLTVRGASMSPTLNDGDTILVDRKKTGPLENEIYVFRTGDDLSVKRILVDVKKGSITISGDNPQYGAQTGVDPDSIEIIGRVIWIGRRA